ncbi:hypothetical protein, partial [uncultured Flavonifractor sp.]|uniref:hypothetical protein n=1 Tax=uncultured Flavonifractor sp. TaxID=1193534 RepID=UPI00266F252F
GGAGDVGKHFAADGDLALFGLQLHYLIPSFPGVSAWHPRQSGGKGSIVCLFIVFYFTTKYKGKKFLQSGNVHL